MSARDLDTGWFSRERVLTLLLCLATLLSLYLCYRLVLPFIPALAITIALLDIWKWRTAAGHTAEEAVTPGASTLRPAA